MMEETYLMNVIKEKVCYVPLDFERDMNITKLRGAKNTVKVQYVLPDYVTCNLGYVKGKDPLPPMPAHMTGHPRPEEQILEMNVERLVPEFLFRPNDIGINQAGIAEVIVQAVNECAPEIHPLLYSNIVLCVGNCMFPGFKERLEKDLRAMVPIEFEINIFLSEKPHLAAWRGGSMLASLPKYKALAVMREEYEEAGISNYLVCKRRFDTL